VGSQKNCVKKSGWKLAIEFGVTEAGSAVRCIPA